MSSTQHTPHSTTRAAAEPQISLLTPDYTPAILNGQILAVPLRPAECDTEFVPALINGEVAAVPVHNPLAVPAAAAQLEPAAIAPAQPVTDPGLPLAVRHCLLYGSLAAVAAGGAVWMVGAAVAAAAPHADELGELLQHAAILVGVVVLGLAALLGKLRTLTGPTTGTGTGASVTASGTGATATGTVLALVHRTTTTTIGRQSAWGRGGITNHTG
ncbi:hypothetical protein [Streptomyces sp. NRRL B-24484]|uniref:hypothetical protein n=1 Tax=Streptomyces sp. NRRL B-24484 TaxID=1463833 RepID=UPI0004BF55A0|nr:hypothetical protein [Streptomyces sp. NRRL B-24484]